MFIFFVTSFEKRLEIYLRNIYWRKYILLSQPTDYNLIKRHFLKAIADATIAECVRLDGGAHKRCETLLAWSQLMQFMFSNVRDGYYAQVRQQRRSSLPQQKLQKQFSTATSLQKKTFDMALWERTGGRASGQNGKRSINMCACD